MLCYLPSVSVCCPIPCQIDGIPSYSAILRRLCHPICDYSFCCRLFLVLVFSVTLCLGTYLLVLLCLPWPTRWVQNCSSCFSCLSALRLPSCLFVLVSQLCRSSSWRYDWSHYDPSQPCSLGTRPAHICLCFVFLFYLSSSYFTRFFGRVSWVFPGLIWFARYTG